MNLTARGFVLNLKKRGIFPSAIKILETMKTLSVICYIVGSVLILASCFVSGATVWWLGGAAILVLILGCIFQYNGSKGNVYARHDRNH